MSQPVSSNHYSQYQYQTTSNFAPQQHAQNSNPSQQQQYYYTTQTQTQGYPPSTEQSYYGMNTLPSVQSSVSSASPAVATSSSFVASASNAVTQQTSHHRDVFASNDNNYQAEKYFDTQQTQHTQSLSQSASLETETVSTGFNPETEPVLTPNQAVGVQQQQIQQTESQLESQSQSLMHDTHPQFSAFSDKSTWPIPKIELSTNGHHAGNVENEEEVEDEEGDGDGDKDKDKLETQSQTQSQTQPLVKAEQNILMQPQTNELQQQQQQQQLMSFDETIYYQPSEQNPQTQEVYAPLQVPSQHQAPDVGYGSSNYNSSHIGYSDSTTSMGSMGYNANYNANAGYYDQTMVIPAPSHYFIPGTHYYMNNNDSTGVQTTSHYDWSSNQVQPSYEIVQEHQTHNGNEHEHEHEMMYSAYDNDGNNGSNGNTYTRYDDSVPGENAYHSSTEFVPQQDTYSVGSDLSEHSDVSNRSVHSMGSNFSVGSKTSSSTMILPQMNPLHLQQYQVGGSAVEVQANGTNATYMGPSIQATSHSMDIIMEETDRDLVEHEESTISASGPMLVSQQQQQHLHQQQHLPQPSVQLTQLNYFDAHSLTSTQPQPQPQTAYYAPVTHYSEQYSIAGQAASAEFQPLTSNFEQTQTPLVSQHQPNVDPFQFQVAQNNIQAQAQAQAPAQAQGVVNMSHPVNSTDKSLVYPQMIPISQVQADVVSYAHNYARAQVEQYLKQTQILAENQQSFSQPIDTLQPALQIPVEGMPQQQYQLSEEASVPVFMPIVDSHASSFVSSTVLDQEQIAQEQDSAPDSLFLANVHQASLYLAESIKIRQSLQNPLSVQALELLNSISAMADSLKGLVSSDSSIDPSVNPPINVYSPSGVAESVSASAFASTSVIDESGVVSIQPLLTDQDPAQTQTQTQAQDQGNDAINSASHTTNLAANHLLDAGDEYEYEYEEEEIDLISPSTAKQSISTTTTTTTTTTCPMITESVQPTTKPLASTGESSITESVLSVPEPTNDPIMESMTDIVAKSMADTVEESMTDTVEESIVPIPPVSIVQNNDEKFVSEEESSPKRMRFDNERAVRLLAANKRKTLEQAQEKSKQEARDRSRQKAREKKREKRLISLREQQQATDTNQATENVPTATSFDANPIALDHAQPGSSLSLEKIKNGLENTQSLMETSNASKVASGSRRNILEPIVDLTPMVALWDFRVFLRMHSQSLQVVNEVKDSSTESVSTDVETTSELTKKVDNVSHFKLPPRKLLASVFSSQAIYPQWHEENYSDESMADLLLTLRTNESQNSLDTASSLEKTTNIVLDKHRNMLEEERKIDAISKNSTDLLFSVRTTKPAFLQEVGASESTAVTNVQEQPNRSSDSSALQVPSVLVPGNLEIPHKLFESMTDPIAQAGVQLIFDLVPHESISLFVDSLAKLEQDIKRKLSEHYESKDSENAQQNVDEATSTPASLPTSILNPAVKEEALLHLHLLGLLESIVVLGAYSIAIAAHNNTSRHIPTSETCRDEDNDNGVPKTETVDASAHDMRTVMCWRAAVMLGRTHVISLSKYLTSYVSNPADMLYGILETIVTFKGLESVQQLTTLES